jgi:hypothetical protein
MSQQTAPAASTARIAWGPVDGGCYIGVFDKPMRRHRIAGTARRWDYLTPPEGPGGHWAYALCERPAWHSTIVSTGSRGLPECPDCVVRS